MQPSSLQNILSPKYVGFKILGINTPQVYIKTLDCRTPMHQETLNVQALNINVGPEDCVWWAIPPDHLEAFEEMLTARRLRIVIDTVWPDFDELLAAGIPVIKIVQKMGDLVVLSTCTPHWVQAKGCSNGLAWNFASLTHQQISVASARVALNKIHGNKSVIPLTHLMWNLVKLEFPVHKDEALFVAFRFVKYCPNRQPRLTRLVFITEIISARPYTRHES